MPKNSTVKMMRRWQAMDAALEWGFLHVPSFARRWKVSEKTVRRDLEDFKELGQTIKMGYDPEAGHTYFYPATEIPLFTDTTEMGPRRIASSRGPLDHRVELAKQREERLKQRKDRGERERREQDRLERKAKEEEERRKTPRKPSAPLSSLKARVVRLGSGAGGKRG